MSTRRIIKNRLYLEAQIKYLITGLMRYWDFDMDNKFGNGSEIHTVETDKPIRGKRANQIIDWGDCQISQETIDAAIKPFIVELREYPSEYAYYVTGTRLPLWQRVWNDKVLSVIKRIKK